MQIRRKQNNPCLAVEGATASEGENRLRCLVPLDLQGTVCWPWRGKAFRASLGLGRHGASPAVFLMSVRDLHPAHIRNLRTSPDQNGLLHLMQTRHPT